MARAGINPKAYGELLKKAQPHPIRNREQYDQTIEQITALMRKGEEALSTEETALLEMLSVLVTKYDREHYQIKPSTPAETITFLMEQRSLKPRDLLDIFGTRGRVSEILSGKRSPSKEQAKRLAQFFHVSADLFI